METFYFHRKRAIVLYNFWKEVDGYGDNAEEQVSKEEVTYVFIDLSVDTTAGNNRLNST